MNGICLALSLTLLTAVCIAQEKGDVRPGTLADAKKAGWIVVDSIVQTAGDKSAYKADEYPGNVAWFTEFRKSTQGCDVKKPVKEWPVISSDSLVTRNPVYWQMHFEVAPADPSLAILHAGLLQMAGYSERSSYVLVIAMQTPGIPDAVRKVMLSMITENNQSLLESHQVMNEGVKLHDKGDFDGALAKYNAAIKLHPHYSVPYYERGYSLRTKAWKAAGITGDEGKEKIPDDSREVREALAMCRLNDPLNYRGYQGNDKNVIEAFMTLTKKGLPAWEKMIEACGQNTLVADNTLREFADAMQAIGVHDLALFARQVIVRRRANYAPDDYPFLEKSLKALAQGKPIDQTLAVLKSNKLLAVRQFTELEAKKAAQQVKKNQKDEFVPKVADIDHVLLLVPTTEIADRVGEVEPFANYMKLIWRKVDEILSTAQPEAVKAQGLMFIVGMKSKNKVRIWCEPIDGAIPPDLLKKLEDEVSKMEAIDLKKSPMAFALNMKLFGRKPDKFEKVPLIWAEAAKKHDVKIVIPPDELFKRIWPD